MFYANTFANMLQNICKTFCKCKTFSLRRAASCRMHNYLRTCQKSKAMMFEMPVRRVC